MKTCLIVEDDLSFAIEVEMILDELGFELIDKATTIEQIKTKTQLVRYDLIISDIKLGNNELSFEYFNSIDIQIPIIYLSILNDERTYKKIQEKKKYLLLVKPIDKVSLLSAIETLKQNIETEHTENPSKKFLLVKQKGEILKVLTSNIQFIKSEGNYCTLYLKDSKLVVRISLSQYINDLPENFVMVHRSFIVNLNSIQSYQLAKQTIIVANDEIPIGRKYRKEFVDAFKSK